MLDILRQGIFPRMFTAQVVALLGTGLLTVALGLLAYDLSGERAGAVLGTALAIKMIAYVALAPIGSAVFERLSRKRVLIAMDGLRAAIALLLPFIDAVWQIYVCIFALQAASAIFTPTFQALIPDLLPNERNYTNALSLSRLAYDLESLISPALAGLLLLTLDFHWLFAGTAFGFAISAAIIQHADLPTRRSNEVQRGFADRLTRGIRIYLATPRLRGLLCLNLAAAAGGSMAIVNTVVVVREGYRGSESDVAMAMAVFGFGSMIAAILMPHLLDRLRDRTVMATAAFAMSVTLLSSSVVFLNGQPSWTGLMVIWFALGLCYALVITPSGRLLRRSAHEEDRPAVFAAQFALSHACWLIAYPLAGWLGHALGMGWIMIILCGLAATGSIIAWIVWPAEDPDIVEHAHADLPADHPHLQNATQRGGVWRHRHIFVIDDEHRAWPTQG